MVGAYKHLNTAEKSIIKNLGRNVPTMKLKTLVGTADRNW